MTEKLYHITPPVLEFKARVLDCAGLDEGRYSVLLDRSAFYPESGGQPWDLGVLGGRNVLEVRQEGGEIVHILDGKLDAGAEVQGSVDSQRRMDNSAHHTAQHLITALFLRHGDYQTRSFRLGSETASIDLSGEITDVLLESVEAEANVEIRAHRKVTTREISREEFESIDLRKKNLPDTDMEQVRLIEIEGLDSAHCGGTHVANTAETGFVVFVRTERVRDLTRLHFLCGDRARRYVAEIRSAAEKAAGSLSVGWRDLPGRVDEILGELKQMRKHRRAAEQEVVDRMVQEFAATDEPFVEIRTDDLDPNHLATLARRLGEQGKIAIVSSRIGLIAIATAPEQEPDAGNVVSMIKKEFPVKGGGRGSFAQLVEVSDEMIPFVRQRIIEIFREAEE